MKEMKEFGGRKSHLLSTLFGLVAGVLILASVLSLQDMQRLAELPVYMWMLPIGNLAVAAALILLGLRGGER